MNYRHLQYFVVVVQQGSLKAASHELGVSQPALSAAIRNLEREFGAPLLDRRREGSVPTPFGQSLYESALTMSTVVEHARARIAALKDPTRQQLRIGTGPSVSTSHLSAAVASVLAAWPSLRVAVVSAESHAALEQKVVVQEIDVALCHVPTDRLPSSLECRLITSNRIGAIVAAAQLRPDQQTISQADMLSGFRWITSRDDEIRRPEGLQLARTDVPGNPITVVAGNLELIKFLTLTSRSIGFLPVHVVESELDSGELLELVATGVHMDRPLYALSRRGAAESPVIGALLASLETSFGRSNGAAGGWRTVEVVA